jgi:SAM-dependent methyltransferase
MTGGRRMELIDRAGEVTAPRSREAIRRKLGSYHAVLTETQQIVGGVLSDRLHPRVLEAGCGSLAYIHFDSNSHVVGIDIDPLALERNACVTERVIGDIETYDLPADSFDAIVCWYVFEHLRNPLAALVRFANATRPGGCVVLALPNVLTPKGLVTKFTPFAFHVWWKRYVHGRKHAGTPGHGPYPTTIPFSIAPRSLLSVAEAAGLEVTYEAYFEDEKQLEARRKFGLDGAAWRLFRWATRVFSGGSLDAEKTEYVLVLTKRRPTASPR